MIRASCQQFKFILPYTVAQLKVAKITFWQKDNKGTAECSLPITKTLNDCIGESDSKELVVTLNQVETLAFVTDRKAFVQFRGLTQDDFAFASRIMPISVYPVCDETVLSEV